jgi:hypothetical protein
VCGKGSKGGRDGSVVACQNRTRNRSNPVTTMTKHDEKSGRSPALQDWTGQESGAVVHFVLAVHHTCFRVPVANP